MLKINGIKYNYDKFAYDGCHKIYLLENSEVEEAEQLDYKIMDIELLPEIYNDSCVLRFINIWNGKNPKTVIPQFYEASIIFEINGLKSKVIPDENDID